MYCGFKKFSKAKKYFLTPVIFLFVFVCFSGNVYAQWDGAKINKIQYATTTGGMNYFFMTLTIDDTQGVDVSTLENFIFEVDGFSSEFTISEGAFPGTQENIPIAINTIPVGGEIRVKRNICAGLPVPLPVCYSDIAVGHIDFQALVDAGGGAWVEPAEIGAPVNPVNEPDPDEEFPPPPPDEEPEPPDPDEESVPQNPPSDFSSECGAVWGGGYELLSLDCIVELGANAQRLFIGLGILIAIFMLPYIGILFASGNEQNIQKGQEMLTALIGGLALLIFGGVIVSIIGNEVFNVQP